jgi:gliding motility-associated-like protein
MKVLRQVLMGILILNSFFTFAQKGKNGAVAISTTGTIVNEYTTLIQDAVSGTQSINVADNGLNSHNRFGTGNNLAAGDLVFIIQMQGADIVSCCDPWAANYGQITSYNNSGLYEFAEVISVQASNIINLRCGLINDYTISGKVQVIRVPRYTSLTISPNIDLTCDTWDGNVGGVLVIENSGNTLIQSGGSISANAKGFRGGIVSGTCANNWNIGFMYTNVLEEGGQKGEGIAGNGVPSDGINGRGAPANGGGGGDAHNSGGGGGSNVCPSQLWNGCGFPDTTTSATYKTAWDLENSITTSVPAGVPFHRNASYGGGRGGYSFSSTNSNAMVDAPGTNAWAGDYRRVNGGLGGWPLQSTVNTKARLFMGGGGGGGSQNDNFGGAGGKGGGIIYILSDGTISGSGTISANGANGGTTTGTASFSHQHAGTDGAGGGGGGGAIALNSIGSITGITAQANGGNGGNQIKTKYILAASNEEAEGPGGGGSGGYIAVSNGTFTKTTNGGSNGTSSAVSPESIGVSEFPPNGATKGSIGVHNDIVQPLQINASNVSVCKGVDTTLFANVTGNVPAGYSIAWYPDYFSTTPLSTTDSLLITNPQNTTTYYVGICPGYFRIPVTVTVISVTANAGNDTTLCNGNSLTLHAQGGISYLWSPTSGLSNPNIASPVCTATSNTLYTVQVTNTNGCTAKDSMMVYVNTVHPVISPDTSICMGTSVTLTASGGTSYHWNTGSNSTSITVAPSNSTTYSVSVTNNGCSSDTSVSVTVMPLPQVNLGNDTSVCSGTQITLDAGIPGMTYGWNNASLVQSIYANSSGWYWVDVTDTNQCTKRDSLYITWIPWANATINPVNPLCNNDNSLILSAAQNSGVWTGNGITNTTTGLFDPSVATIGNNSVIYTISGLCGDADTILIQVLAAPQITAAIVQPNCSNELKGSISLSVNSGTVPFQYLWNTQQTADSIVSLDPGIYHVTVTDANQCKGNYEVSIEIPNDLDCSEGLYIPNVFSPNHDGANDILFVHSNNLKSFEFFIYDRWGNKVFETSDISKGWDGEYHGKPLQEDVYSYVFKGSTLNDKKISRNGNITLVR